LGLKTSLKTPVLKPEHFCWCRGILHQILDILGCLFPFDPNFTLCSSWNDKVSL